MSQCPSCGDTRLTFNPRPTGQWDEGDLFHCAGCGAEGESANLVEITPDQYTHAFRTFLGLPPAKGDAPACGATLTDAYDFPGVERPVCPQCQELLHISSRPDVQV